MFLAVALGAISPAINYSPLAAATKVLSLREQKQLLKQHYKSALEAYSRKDYASAINHWSKILEIDPEQTSAKDMIEKVQEENNQFNRKKQKEAAALIEQGRFKEARDLTKIIIANDPTNATYKKQIENLEKMAKAATEAAPKQPVEIKAEIKSVEPETKPKVGACLQTYNNVKQPTANDCVELTSGRGNQTESIGCYYAAQPALGQNPPALLIYLRGWHPVMGKTVPLDKRLESARFDFTRFNLSGTAEANNLVVLVTGSSDSDVTQSDIATIEKATKVKFGQVYLAAHSGGYTGLAKTLSNLSQVNRIILLDNFYFGSVVAKSIKKRTDKGMACTGFYTEHNKSRYEKYFKTSVQNCPVELHADIYPHGHNDSVNTCLGTYLTKTSCP